MEAALRPDTARRAGLPARPAGVTMPEAYVSSTQGIPDSESVPRHVAIIMDGNGRWAKQRLLPRVAGHHRGVEEVVRGFGDIVIEQPKDAHAPHHVKAVDLLGVLEEVLVARGLIGLIHLGQLDVIGRHGLHGQQQG